MKPNRQQSSRQVTIAENALFKAILMIESIDEARAFFGDLCTPAEMQAMVDRWAVVQPLIDGESYRDISEKTGVSVTTIGRVARFLTQGNGGYQVVHDRLRQTASESRDNP